MYLLVFITLVISLIGLYTQTFALQTARMMSHQTGFASAMIAWHGTAMGMAHYAIPSASLNGQTGCSLTAGLTNPSVCTDGLGDTVLVQGSSGSISSCATTVPPNHQPCLVSLPGGYEFIPYSFYSIAYQVPPTNQKYVITFVPPPNATTTAACGINNFVCLPGDGPTPAAPATQYQLGITLSDLLVQIRQSGLPILAYGTVQNGLVMTNAVSGGTVSAGLQYPTPSNGIVPNGSVAIISSPDNQPCPNLSSYVNGICTCLSGSDTGLPVPVSGACPP